MNDAMMKHPEADVLVNFASLRSAYQSTVETMDFPQIRTIAIIAEGIPENQTRKLIKLANEKNVSIIGPATVGGLKPGCFKIGNTGGKYKEKQIIYSEFLNVIPYDTAQPKKPR